MNLCRCTNCGSWFDLLRFPRCPVCGADSIPMASVRSTGGLPSRGGADLEAAQDRKVSQWTLLVGILLGLAGPLTLFRSGSPALAPMLLVLFLLLVVVTIFGLTGNPKADPMRYAAGQVARNALLTIAICIALAALVGGAALVLIFVACVA